jgi:hypothetical protein
VGAPVIVARARTLTGGPCARCRRFLAAGEPIRKVDLGTRGGSTRYGHGLGEWWCLQCVDEKFSSWSDTSDTSEELS